MGLRSEFRLRRRLQPLVEVTIEAYPGWFEEYTEIAIPLASAEVCLRSSILAGGSIIRAQSAYASPGQFLVTKMPAANRGTWQRLQRASRWSLKVSTWAVSSTCDAPPPLNSNPGNLYCVVFTPPNRPVQDRAIHDREDSKPRFTARKNQRPAVLALCCSHEGGTPRSLFLGFRQSARCLTIHATAKRAVAASIADSIAKPKLKEQRKTVSKKLEGKTALITGGSRGIGAAIAKRLAADGANVAITYTKGADAAASVVTEIEHAGGKAIAIQADATDADASKAAVEKTVASFGGLDVLVNNAAPG